VRYPPISSSERGDKETMTVVEPSMHLRKGQRGRPEHWIFCSIAGTSRQPQDTMTYYEGLKSTTSSGHGKGKGTGRSSFLDGATPAKDMFHGHGENGQTVGKYQNGGAQRWARVGMPFFVILGAARC
jgi:hypothetical protein